MLIDARNMECPKPVIMVKQAIENIDDGVVDILLNSEISKENVTRFLKQNGLLTEVLDCGKGEYKLTVAKGYECDVGIKKQSSRKIVFVKSDRIGDNIELGSKLIKGFIAAMVSANEKPAMMIFVNSGVYLTTIDDNMELIDNLRILEQQGVQIFSCGACLEYYSLQSKLKVGQVGNALDTVMSLLGSGEVVSL